MPRTWLGIVAITVGWAAAAAAVTPFVYGGLGDVGDGEWTFYRGQTPEIVPTYYGSSFFLGGGFSFPIAQFRQKRTVPTLCLDTDGGFTYHKQKLMLVFSNETVEPWEHSFFGVAFSENLVFRLRIPIRSRLLTPFVGVGGGVAVVPGHIQRERVAAGRYDASTVAIKPVYEVPFGLEVTLSPQHTIFGRFGPTAPTGCETFTYTNAQGRAEDVCVSLPNSFLVVFGYRAGF